jgi:tetratricopeptide (TPR) repeat protein
VRSFVGRDDQLTALRAQLNDQGAATVVPTTALTGMGGIGKTQLALAYAQRHRGDYTLGWWVPSETELGMLTALAELGAVLGLPAELPPVELAARTRDALGDRSGWLLIFDNAPNSTAIADYLPGAGHGHVLVTSRDSAWQGIADPVPVDLLSAEDAVELLVRRTGDPDQHSAARLAEALGRLPLALEQAAAYAASRRLSLAGYLELFEQRRVELLAMGKPLAYQGTVDATFTLAREQLQAANPAAVLLLDLCALLAPDEIPLPQLLSDPTVLPEPLAAAVADPIQRGEVIGALFQASLLTRDVGETARIHRLVQAVTLAHLPDAYRNQRIIDAVELLAELFPSDPEEPDQWSMCAQLLAHSQAVLDHARRRNLNSPSRAYLLAATGSYIRETGLNIGLARDLHQQALTISEGLYDGDHELIASILTALGVDLYQLREYEQARDLDERALAMCISGCAKVMTPTWRWPWRIFQPT